MRKDRYKYLRDHLSPEEQEKWILILQEMDREMQNNDRKHRYHLAEWIDATIVNRGPTEDETYSTRDLLKLSYWKDWDDLISSQRPEDLYELVAEYPTSAALKELTLPQKEAIWEYFVNGTSTEELAKRKGCSTRNITKHRQKGIEAVREAVTGHKDLDEDA